MTAALYDIKAKFSEYVTYAEQGEVIEITKHGKVSVVMISKKNFDENYNHPIKKNPIEEWKNWRSKMSQEEIHECFGVEYSEILEQERKESRNQKERGSLCQD